MMNTVGVTMFFNLKPLFDQTQQTRPTDFYKNNCRATISLNYPLVIFCDSETREWIEPLRQSLSTALTYYVEKNITDYEHYAINYPIVKRNRTNPFYTNPDNRNTASYFLTTTFKFHALQMASEIVPNASHLVWVDFGCQHVVLEANEKLAAIFANPKPKVAITYIHYRSTQEIRDIVHTLSNGGICSLAGGIFSVEKAYVSLLYTRALSILYEQISKGVGHAEEQIFMYIYDRFPEMFTLCYGDYYSLITNYHNPVRDYYCIRYHFIQNALNAGRKDLAKTAAEAVLEAHRLQLIALEQSEVTFLDSLL